MQEVLAEPAGEGVPFSVRSAEALTFFLVQNAHLIMIIIVTKNTHSVLQLN